MCTMPQKLCKKKRNKQSKKSKTNRNPGSHAHTPKKEHTQSLAHKEHTQKKSTGTQPVIQAGQREMQRVLPVMATLQNSATQGRQSQMQGVFPPMGAMLHPVAQGRQSQMQGVFPPMGAMLHPVAQGRQPQMQGMSRAMPAPMIQGWHPEMQGAWSLANGAGQARLQAGLHIWSDIANPQGQNIQTQKQAVCNQKMSAAFDGVNLINKGHVVPATKQMVGVLPTKASGPMLPSTVGEKPGFTYFHHPHVLTEVGCRDQMRQPLQACHMSPFGFGLGPVILTFLEQMRGCPPHIDACVVKC